MDIKDVFKTRGDNTPKKKAGHSGFRDLTPVQQQIEEKNPFKTDTKPKLDIFNTKQQERIGKTAEQVFLKGKKITEATPEEVALFNEAKSLTPQGVVWPRILPDRTSDALLEPEALTVLGTLNDPLNTGKRFGYWQHDRALHTHIIGASGEGKGLENSTEILTPQGTIEIGKLKVGDTVIGGSGLPCKVTGVFPQGTEKVFKIKFSDSTAVIADAAHRWLLENKGWQTPRILTTGEIAAGGIKDAVTQDKYAVVIPVIKKFNDDIPVEDFYNLGGRLGGHSKGDAKSAHLLSEFRGIFRGVSVKESIDDIHIPKMALRAPESHRKALLQGIMDKCGVPIMDSPQSHHTSIIEFSSTSLCFATDVRELVVGLGGLAIPNSINVAKRKYLLTIYFTEAVVPFRNKNKLEGYVPAAPILWATKNTKYGDMNLVHEPYKELGDKDGLSQCGGAPNFPPTNFADVQKQDIEPKDKPLVKYMVSVEDAGEAECTCIMVDDPSHCFITGNYTLTHNSTLIKSIFYQDMYAGRGAMLIDPHGDVAEELLDRIPPWRMNDVVYLDFTNKDQFIGLNALETFNGTVDEKQMVTESIISILHKQFGSSWGPNLENNLRHALLSLVDTPDMTLLEVNNLFLDPVFRDAILKNVTDRTILNFWEQEFLPKSATEQQKGTASVNNKIRQYIANTTLRSIIGQSKTTVDFADLMDNGAIVIVNLSKGHTTELVSTIVGSIIVNKVLSAALSRQGRVPEDERRRFHLIIDEFQNFVTDDFATILSEARKYGLALTVAHQNMGQLEELKAVKNSIENNVQNRIVYSLGVTDSKYFERFFAPYLTATDLANLPAYHVATKIRENRQKGKAFTARTLPPIKKMATAEAIKKIVYERSIAKYTTSKEEAEREFNERMDYGKKKDKGKGAGSNATLL